MKRVVKLIVPAVALGAVLVLLKRRPAPPSASPTAPPTPAPAPAQRPASHDAPLVTPSTASDAPPSDDPVDPAWVPPAAEGGCPDGYPVKAKTASKIFHVPGGTMYTRTVPDRCYTTAEAAELDGFRPSKR